MIGKDITLSLIFTILGIVAGILAASFQSDHQALAADNNTTMTDGAMMLKGQISNVQFDSANNPGWIQSGIWVLRVFPTSETEHPSVFLVAEMGMVKPDGTAMHRHEIFNFQASGMTQEANVTTLNGTATITMKDGPVTDVPLTIKIFNEAVIGMWIGPDKVDSHFGTNPIYGTLVTHTKQMNMSGQESPNTIKMSAKEVDEIYRWSTIDGINPTLKISPNTSNIIQIDNPTDTKHELVIESNDTEVASSGDVAPDSSGQLMFKPAMNGTFEYHCEYHPDTMKGTIEVLVFPNFSSLATGYGSILTASSRQLRNFQS